jgi:hypothetical protein
MTVTLCRGGLTGEEISETSEVSKTSEVCAARAPRLDAGAIMDS